MGEEKIIIVGAGIGGLSAGICLKEAGFSVRLLERFDEVREVGAGILLAPNASSVLYERGLGTNLEAVSAPMTDFEIRSWRGKVFVNRKFDAEEWQGPARMIHRAALQGVLLDAVGRENVELSAQAVGYEPGENAATVVLEDGRRVIGRAVIGADGVHSKIREAIQGKGELQYHGYTCWRGITESFEHPDFDFGMLMEIHGPGLRTGMGYIDEDRVYWWATANRPEGQRDELQSVKSDLLTTYREFPDFFHAMIEATPVEQVLRNDIHDRRPTNQWGQGAVTLLGDAAHPMAPNVGQGACSAIEDAAVLARCLEQYDAPEEAFRLYERIRQPRTADLQKISKQFGTVGQWKNPLVVWLRELSMVLTPHSVMQRQQRRIWDYDVERQVRSERGRLRLP